ncbi:MAG: hypothetical protein J7K40_05440 [candidate division Zixibacteria bacterium]|nr:hypothetical protein [candidate division Zixibacteria bacterium]
MYASELKKNLEKEGLYGIALQDIREDVAMDESEYEKIESRLLTAVGEFEHRWDKAWYKWLGTHDIPDDIAADMVNFCPYDEEGNTLPEAEAWYAMYAVTKTSVEKEFNCEIIVDPDGSVFAIHHLPDGDTITVP